VKRAKEQPQFRYEETLGENTGSRSVLLTALCVTHRNGTDRAGP
jgi:hypothetical protein